MPADKTGDVRSVSLPPVHFCTNCSMCMDECYVIRNIAWRPEVVQRWSENGVMLKERPWDFFNGIAQDIQFHRDRFFRWHVSGDITNPGHFGGMIQVAQVCPDTRFLAFTKSYDIVNEYVSDKGMPPKNLIIVFSRWDGLPCDNPHKFPESYVIRHLEDIGENIPSGTRLCTGNCTNCAMGKNKCGWKGCWTLHRGTETHEQDYVGFPIH